MKIAKTVYYMFILMMLSVASTGCATYRTYRRPHQEPEGFSGTRLDINVIGGNEIGIRKFKVAPPAYRWLTFHLVSFLNLIFPLTFSVATYEFNIRMMTILANGA